MKKDGYVILLLSDVFGYVNVRIYPNDEYLVNDAIKQLEIIGIDHINYFQKTKQDTLVLVKDICENYGVSVRDFSGDIFDINEYYSISDLEKILDLDFGGGFWYGF